MIRAKEESFADQERQLQERELFLLKPDPFIIPLLLT